MNLDTPPLFFVAINVTKKLGGFMSVRGSTWKHISKKAGYSQSIGSYSYQGAKKLYGNDRYFVLTSIRTGKTRTYESPQAAIKDGWSIQIHGK